jgi:hypothetical protein
MKIKTPLTRVWLSLALVSLAACSSGSNSNPSPTPGDSATMSSNGRWHVQVKSSDVLALSTPALDTDDEGLVVTGTVTRTPSANGVIPGHLLFSVLSAQSGNVLDQFTTLWDPEEIPTNGNRSATYQVHYGRVPPDGSIVRIEHEKVDNPDDVSTYGAAGGAKGGHHGGGSHSSWTP